jgi:hypothetical protein
VRIGYAIEGVKIANEGESPSGDGSRMSGIPSAPEGKTHKCELKLFWTAIMPVQNRPPCRFRTKAGAGPRLWRGAGGLARARPRERGRAPASVPQLPFGCQPQPCPL